MKRSFPCDALEIMDLKHLTDTNSYSEMIGRQIC